MNRNNMLKAMMLTALVVRRNQAEDDLCQAVAGTRIQIGGNKRQVSDGNTFKFNLPFEKGRRTPKCKKN
jgi:hypothetical protein